MDHDKPPSFTRVRNVTIKLWYRARIICKANAQVTPLRGESLGQVGRTVEQLACVSFAGRRIAWTVAVASPSSTCCVSSRLVIL